MALVTVLISTFDHADLIAYAIKSAKTQTLQDFEILVVGDGAPARTDEIMEKLCAEDSRIHYFPHPKGLGHGEEYRHAALQSAQGKYVCYLGDDDLWLPQHLEVMSKLLIEYDFVHTLHINMRPGSNLFARGGDVTKSLINKPLIQLSGSSFGPTCVGHTMSAYKKLPFGWRPKPEGVPSDIYMWKQWLEQPWCRFHSAAKATTLHFGSPQRKNWSILERLNELEYWWEKIQKPDFPDWLIHEVVKDWQPRVLKPEDFVALGSAFLNSEQYGEAAKYFRHAAELNNHSPNIYTLLSQALLKLDRIEEAIASTKETVKI